MLKSVLSENVKVRSAVLAMNAQSVQHIDIAADLAARMQKEIIIQFSAKYIPYFNKLIGLNYLVDKYQRINIYSFILIIVRILS